MPQIGVLTTGAGVVTNITGQSQCESVITIGDVDTANPLQGITVEVDGVAFINIQGAATLVTAFMKWLNNIAGANIIGLCLKIATGKIERTTNYRFTNAGATTPAILAYSDNAGGVPVVAGTKSINASSYEDFSKFSCLLIQTPANVSSVDVVFTNNHKQTMAMIDIDTLYNMQRPGEADGRLGGVSVIDNTAGTIKAVRVYATTAVTVAVVKLPDASFEAMKAAVMSI